MKKQLQTRINQEEKEKNYNSLSSRVYRVCTAPSTFEELEKSIKSKVITPFGEVQVDVLFLGREIVMKFFHGKKKISEKITLPSDNYGIFFGSSSSPCGNFLWSVRKYNARGRVQLIINKKYYKQNKPIAKRGRKKKRKRKIEEINKDLIGITEKRESKKSKNFIPNFEKPSTSSYY